MLPSYLLCKSIDWFLYEATLAFNGSKMFKLQSIFVTVNLIFKLQSIKSSSSVVADYYLFIKSKTSNG